MKIIYSAPLLFVLIFLNTRLTIAQENKITVDPRNEIGVSVGIGTIQEFVITLGEAFANSLYNKEPKDSKGSGAITVFYNYFPSKKFAVGLSGTWEKLTTTYEDTGGGETELKWNVLIIMADCRYYYVAKPAFRLYSGIGAGYTNFDSKYASSRSSNGVFAFQVSAIGARFGNSFGAFAELGLDMKAC